MGKLLTDAQRLPVHNSPHMLCVANHYCWLIISPVKRTWSGNISEGSSRVLEINDGTMSDFNIPYAVRSRLMVSKRALDVKHG